MDSLWLLPFFPLVWFAASHMIATHSGWRALAARFPQDAAPPSGQRFRFVSGRMGRVHGMPIHYANCLTVSVGPENLSISMVWFLRLHSPALSLPWSQVEAVEPIAKGQDALFRLRGGEAPKEFVLEGRAAQAALVAFGAARGVRAQPPGHGRAGGGTGP
ncbi:hypothetical protein M4R22_20865 [Acidovorax sp. GBBC 3334]|uniref:hypothetical protein n=1 Tax=Acidovorax sp. GBBC 3334 TaxID=2940496 RepID=UPI002303F10D|nr:hypothetical protein [Acidovorax sp. GBBC 3334]MDA8457217.1 hypothetical protein [Acidovorax sp. GBBC 3334]